MDGREVSDQDTGHAALHVLENRQTKIRCVAHGGSPSPTIEVFSGRRDVTSDFTYRKGATLSGRRGMRLIVYRTERYAHAYKPKAQDDDLTLRCSASVPGLKPLVASVRLDVDCKCIHHRTIIAAQLFKNKGSVLKHDGTRFIIHTITYIC